MKETENDKRKTFLFVRFHRVCDPGGIRSVDKGACQRIFKGKLPLVLIRGVFELYYSENRGAAFGMLQEKQLFFFLIAVLVLAGVLYMLWRMPDGKHYRPLAVCLMLIASGAVGNMIDRITQSYVVDFLYFSLINFPIFNVADCYVTCSAVGLVLLIMFYYKDEDMAVFSFKRKAEISETGTFPGNSRQRSADRQIPFYCK